MANEAERVVVALLADTGNFDVKMKQSATAFGGSMKQIETSAAGAERATGTAMTRVGESMRQTQQRTRQLGFQISDIGTQLSAGSSPFLILAQQGPQVANALDGARGAVGRFATFLSGPFGAAMLAAVSILGVFLTRNRESADSVDDLVEKLKDQAQKARDAKAAQDEFGDTIEGVTAALRDNEEALQKLEGAQDSSAEAALREAEAQREKLVAIRESTVALIAQAKAQAEAVASAARFAGVGGDAAQRGVQAALARVEQLEGDLQEAQIQLNVARSQIRRAQAAVSVERGSESAEERINRIYNKRVADAQALAVAQNKVGKALEDQVKAINEAREAELKRLRETRRERERGLPAVTGAEVARALGTTINPGGGTRTAAQNRAAGGAANSYHLAGQAIDIPLTVNGRPLTKAGIRAALEPLGIVIKELLGPGDPEHDDHFHIAFDKRRRGGDEIAAAQERAAEQLAREIEAELRRVQAFQNELADLQGDEIDARQALITSAEELARLEMEAIEISRQRYDDNLSALVEQKKLTDEEAAELRALNDERARLRGELVKRREDERRFRVAEADRQRAADFALAQIDNEADVLEGQADLARTVKERRDIEQRLIDLQFRAERIQNDIIIAYAERLKHELSATDEARKNAEAAAAEARLRNSTLEERRGNAQGQNAAANLTPLEDFFGRIPSDMAEINESLENVAAGGLATFTDALTDAIVNFRSLKDVGLATLQAITAGLVRMAIQQLILRTVGKALGQSAAATSATEGAAVATAWAPAAASVALATLGAAAGPAAAALIGTHALSQALSVAKLRDGGPIFGPGGPRGDRIPVLASDGEYMIRASSAAKLGRAALDSINLTGELPALANGGPAGRSVRISNTAAAGRQGAIGMDEAFRRELRSIVSDAVHAMPDVKLYPTLDPAKALEAALNSPGGQRAMFGFFRQNSGKVGSSLRQ